jgi:hypothetical protein
MTSTDTAPSDVFSVYTVSWEVFNGAKWEKSALAATPDKVAADEWAEKMRNHPRARTRKVQITEQRVREVRTAILPYWVAAGESA